MNAYKVGQLVKNPVSKLVRKITKIAGKKVFWVSKDGKKKGSCTLETFTKWTAGNN